MRAQLLVGLASSAFAFAAMAQQQPVPQGHPTPPPQAKPTPDPNAALRQAEANAAIRNAGGGVGPPGIPPVKAPPSGVGPRQFPLSDDKH